MSSERGVIPLSAKLTKMPNTLKQFVGNLSTNCLSVFGHFIKTAISKFCCFPQIVYCSTENADVKVFTSITIHVSNSKEYYKRLRGHSFSTYVKFSESPTFVTP